MALSPLQVAQFHTDGYLVIPDFATPQECNDMMQRMHQLIDDFDPSTVSIFQTKDQKQTTDEYFLNSSNEISFFFEAKAIEQPTDASRDAPRLLVPKHEAINKIGHALHDLDPIFRSFSRSDKMASLLKSLQYKQPTPVQSMYIVKPPRCGGEVAPHQDATFLATEPRDTVLGLWVALQDATRENGCLYAEPGSHTLGVQRRFVLTHGHDDDEAHAQAEETQAEANKSSYAGASRGVTFIGTPPPYHADKMVPLPVKAGTLVLIHSAVLHMSHENVSDTSRHAYTVHVVEGEAGHVSYSSRNWLQRRASFPFEPLYTLLDS